MARVVWSHEALRDTQRLFRFLAEKNQAAANRAIGAIRAGVNLLIQQPRVGRPVDGMAPEFREWLIDFGDSGYVALYHFDGQTAVLLAIRHQREAGY